MVLFHNGIAAGEVTAWSDEYVGCTCAWNSGGSVKKNETLVSLVAFHICANHISYLSQTLNVHLHTKGGTRFSWLQLGSSVPERVAHQCWITGWSPITSRKEPAFGRNMLSMKIQESSKSSSEALKVLSCWVSGRNFTNCCLEKETRRKF